MAPERTDRLIREVQQWCKTHRVKHKDLAVILGMTPQGVTEMFKGRANPTGEQALHLQELLRTKPAAMKDRNQKPK
jgi:plasmid maintenance system antidote protein VapI